MKLICAARDMLKRFNTCQRKHGGTKKGYCSSGTEREKGVFVLRKRLWNKAALET